MAYAILFSIRRLQMTMFDYVKEAMTYSLWNRLESIKMDPKSRRSDYSTFRSFLLGRTAPLGMTRRVCPVQTPEYLRMTRTALTRFSSVLSDFQGETSKLLGEIEARSASDQEIIELTKSKGSLHSKYWPRLSSLLKAEVNSPNLGTSKRITETFEEAVKREYLSPLRRTTIQITSEEIRRRIDVVGAYEWISIFYEQSRDNIKRILKRYEGAKEWIANRRRQIDPKSQEWEALGPGSMYMDQYGLVCARFIGFAAAFRLLVETYTSESSDMCRDLMQRLKSEAI